MFFKKKSKRESIEQHIEKYLGKIHMVFHELVSPDFHLDLYWVKTTLDEKKVNILITGGMSERKMNTPPGMTSFLYAELCILLPEDWKLSIEDFKEENHYWPIRLLKNLGRYPFENNTWLGMEHTIGNQDGLAFSENVPFKGSLLFVPMSVNRKFYAMKYQGDQINFFCVIPLYSEEIQLKRDHGTDLLFKKLEEAKIRDLVDITRKNVGLN